MEEIQVDVLPVEHIEISDTQAPHRRSIARAALRVLLFTAAAAVIAPVLIAAIERLDGARKTIPVDAHQAYYTITHKGE